METTSRRDPFSEHLHVKETTTVVAALERRAFSSGCTVSDEVRRAIRRYLESEAKR